MEAKEKVRREIAAPFVVPEGEKRAWMVAEGLVKGAQERGELRSSVSGPQR